MHRLRPFLGSSNPKKHKNKGLPAVKRQDGTLCVLNIRAEAQDRWIEFFSHMEGGARVSTEQYRALWLANLGRIRNAEPFCLNITEVPSLVELETAYRLASVGKAIGEDGMPPELCRYKV